MKFIYNTILTILLPICSIAQQNLTLFEKQIDIGAFSSGTDFAIDKNGDILIVGYVSGINQLSKASLLKLNSSGILSWHKLYQNNFHNGFSAIKINSINDQIIVAGSSSNPLGNGFPSVGNIFQYSQTGDIIWYDTIMEVPNTSPPFTILRNIAFSGDSLIFAIGKKYNSWIIVKYDINGQQKNLYNYPMANFDFNPINSYFNSISTHNDTLIIGGYVDSALIKLGIIIKLDFNGNIYWDRKYYPLDGTIFTAPLIKTNDGNYLLSGSSKTLNSTIWNGFIIKVAPNGDTLWQKTYNFDNKHFGISSVDNADGDYIVAGSIKDQNDIISAFLMKIDANGDSIWLKKYPRAPTSNFNAVKRYPSSGYIAVGNCGKTNGGTDTYIIKTDENGNVEIQTSITAPDEKFDIQIKVEPNPASQLLKIHVDNIPFHINQTELIIYDINGKLIHKEFQNNIIRKQYFDVNIEKNAPGIYYFVVQNKNEILATGKYIKH